MDSSIHRGPCSARDLGVNLLGYTFYHGVWRLRSRHFGLARPTRSVAVPAAVQEMPVQFFLWIFSLSSAISRSFASICRRSSATSEVGSCGSESGAARSAKMLYLLAIPAEYRPRESPVLVHFYGAFGARGDGANWVLTALLLPNQNIICLFYFISRLHLN